VRECLSIYPSYFNFSPLTMDTFPGTVVSLLSVKKLQQSVATCRLPGTLLPGLKFQLDCRMNFSPTTNFIRKYSGFSAAPLPFLSPISGCGNLAKLTDRVVELVKLKGYYPSSHNLFRDERLEAPTINDFPFKLDSRDWIPDIPTAYPAQLESEMSANYLHPYNSYGLYVYCVQNLLERIRRVVDKF
jgi:hypothetical protein